LLPFLAEHFHHVVAVDFAQGMLSRAREVCQKLKNVEFLRRGLINLGDLKGRLDVAVAVNSLVLPDVTVAGCGVALDPCLLEAGRPVPRHRAGDRRCPLLHVLLLDRPAHAACRRTRPARTPLSRRARVTNNFAFGDFTYQGLEQHFWQPFESALPAETRAGFRKIRTKKVWLSWSQFGPAGQELSARTAAVGLVFQADA